MKRLNLAQGLESFYLYQDVLVVQRMLGSQLVVPNDGGLKYLIIRYEKI